MTKPVMLAVVGTRPEAIKVAPLVLEARAAGQFEVVMVASGQHREPVFQALATITTSARRSRRRGTG